MRALTADTFNTLATRAEVEETLDGMRRNRHVSRNIVYEHLKIMDGITPPVKYQLTLGKLMGLASTKLGVGTEQLAKRLKVTIKHPVDPLWVS